MKKALAALLAIALAVSLAACGGSTSGSGSAAGYPGSPEADALVYNLVYEPQDMNTITSADGASMTVNHYITDGLLNRSADASPVPAIAQSWEFDEATLTYTFHLRTDAKWWNGDPVTAKDFVFAWTKLLSPDAASSSSFQGYLLKNGRAFANGEVSADALGVKAVDDYTLEVQLENPCGYALFMFTCPFFYPVNEAFYNSCKEAYATDTEYILGNGRYKLAEWSHENRIVLEKNDGYYDAGAVQVQKMTFTMISDTNAALNAFMAGELDILPQLSAEQAVQLAADGLTVGRYNNNSARYVLFNCTDSFFSNADIRRAFSQAIDRSVIAGQILNDGSEAAYSFCPSVFRGVEKSFIEEAGAPFITDDPAAAKALLDKGLAAIGKTLEDMNNAKLAIVVDENSVYQRVAAYLQEQWRTQLGVNIDINVMPKKSRIETVFINHQFSIAYSTWGPDYNDPTTNLEMFESGNGNNGGLFSDPRMDELMAKADKETDAAKRIGYLAQCEKIVMDEAAVAPMYFECTNFIVSDKILGYAPVNWSYALDWVTLA